MALQPKSTNLPEINDEHVPHKTASSTQAQFTKNVIPGSENTPVRSTFENPKLQQTAGFGVSPGLDRANKDCTPPTQSKRSSVTPTKNDQINNEQALQQA